MQTIPSTSSHPPLGADLDRLWRMFQRRYLAQTIAVIRDLPESDSRRAPLLKHWEAARQQLGEV